MILQATGSNLPDIIKNLPPDCTALMAVRDGGVWTVTYEE